MGRVDLFHSRRTNYLDCKYWVRDERDSRGNPSQWVLMNQPSGIFHAKLVSPFSNQRNITAGVWSTDSNHVTLETDDEVSDIKSGCIVEFDSQLWLVESVQGQIHNKESEFSKHLDYKYFIALKKG